MKPVLKRTDSGIDYIENVSFWELMRITDNPLPICDECLKDLIWFEDVVIIPILNEAICKSCSKKVLERLVGYQEDRKIQRERTNYYCSVLNIER